MTEIRRNRQDVTIRLVNSYLGDSLNRTTRNSQINCK